MKIASADSSLWCYWSAGTLVQREVSSRNILLGRMARWPYFVIEETEMVGTLVKLFFKTVCINLVLLVSLIMVSVLWGSAIREQGFVLQSSPDFNVRLNDLSSQFPL